MITHLKIKNFQRHETLEIELDPQITTITGPSDSGKSAVLRALRWLCFNRPSGDAFIKHGTEKSSVSITVDGKTIRRIKGKGINRYRIDSNNFDAFGQDVPEAVTNLLNLGEENFQRQHDSPFWFFQSAGEVAKELNRIVNLDLIDRVHANLAGQLREAKSEASVTENRLREAEIKEHALEWTKTAHKSLQVIELNNQEAEELKRRRSDLITLLGEIKKQEKISQERIPIDVFDKIMDKAEEYEEVHDRMIGITVLVKRINETERELESWQEKARLAEGKLRKIGICPLCGNKMT